MAQEFVRITFSESDGRRKMRFRQKDLRDVVLQTKTPLNELLGDIFAGWPYLVQYGLRNDEPGITLDKASELMEAWVREPDPETNLPRPIEDLGKKLLDALNASGFVKVELGRKDSDRAPEGNGRQEAVATRSES